MSVQTSRLETAAAVVEWHPTIKTADVVDHPGRPDRRALEIVLEAGVERVPPGALRILAENDCGVSGVQRQGEHLVATIR